MRFKVDHFQGHDKLICVATDGDRYVEPTLYVEYDDVEYDAIDAFVETLVPYLNGEITYEETGWYADDR